MLVTVDETVADDLAGGVDPLCGLQQPTGIGVNAGIEVDGAGAGDVEKGVPRLVVHRLSTDHLTGVIDAADVSLRGPGSQ